MVLEGTQVLFGTCTNLGLKLLRKFKADYLIVDEVVSAKDPDSLLPILSQPSLRAAYFTGDYKQNGPVMIIGEGSRAWDVTPIERMIDSGWPYALVRIQYQAHKELATHTSVRFYDGRIIPFPTSVDRPFSARFCEIALTVNFFDDSGRAFSLNSTKYVFNVHEGQHAINTIVSIRREALVVSTIVQGLMKMGIAPAEVVDLTPYRDQVDLLRTIRAEHGWTSQVETREKFQGSEAQVLYSASSVPMTP
ncbi:MAG: hypothetical protein M1819_002404 [Sarea resinae]|nr:MAG: hypothetical protein M1819_002404 [Sarea resinae]